MCLQINIDEMNLEELREFVDHLITISRMDYETIKSMQKIIDLLEKQQGE